MSAPKPIYEAQLNEHVVLYDATGALFTHERKRWSQRDVRGIQQVYLHASGAMGRDGFAGLLAHSHTMSKYAGSKRDGWPGSPYTFWIPKKPERDDLGRRIVYRCNPDEARTYHTGGRANHTGLSVAFQGQIHPDLPKYSGPPSKDQFVCSRALLDSLKDTHLGLRGKSWALGHCESGPHGGNPKSTCPGPHVMDWLQLYKGINPDICECCGQERP